MKIAIVNDSMLAVESLRRVIVESSEHEVAWVAHDGAEAVWRCTQNKPDLILMDLIMPMMDGVEATRKIMSGSPCAIVIVTATVAGNASKVFQAMGAGALDAVNTPVLGMSGDAEGKDELLRKITTIRKLIYQKKGAIVDSEDINTEPQLPYCSQSLLAIGASSGGPAALAKVLHDLPEDFSSPVVIVQHIDNQFSQELALWLNNQCVLPVRLACEGDVLTGGEVLIAGANDHLVMTSNNHLAYTPHPKEEAYRPSVDVFFDSVTKYWNGDVVGVLLTGMGRDGAQGLLRLRNKGMHTIAQDEATSAVYGMPKAAAKIKAAKAILPLDEIGPSIVDLFAARCVNEKRAL
jgi:chemotaxis response regulator CheB